VSDWPPASGGGPSAGGSKALIAIGVPTIKPEWDDCPNAAWNKACRAWGKNMRLLGMALVAGVWLSQK